MDPKKGSWESDLPIVVALAILSISIGLVVFRDSLLSPGIILYRDIIWTGDLRSFEDRFTSTYNAKLGSWALDDLKRLIIWYVPLKVSYLLQLSPGIPEKVMFYLLFSIIFLSYSFSVFMYLRKRVDRKISLIGGAIAGVVALFSPFTMEWAIVFEFLLGYALMPLLLLSLERAVENGMVWIAPSSILITFMMAGMIHNAFLVGAVILGLMINMYIRSGRSIRLMKQLFRALLSISVSALLSSYWILPAIKAFMAKSVAPPYVVTIESLRMFSDVSSFFDVVRLTGYWWPPIEFIPNDGIFELIWALCSLIIPIIGISFMVKLVKDDWVRVALITFLIGLFVSLGTKNPVYPWIVLRIPLGWLLRVPQKFYSLMSFSYSVSTGVGIGLLGERVKLRRFLLIVILLSALVTSWPMLTGDFNGNLKPVSFPRCSLKEIHSIYREYTENPSPFKVIWFPLELSGFSWHPKPCGDIYIFSSLTPSVTLNNPELRGILIYISDRLAKNETSHVGSYLGVLGCRVVYARNDTVGYEDVRMRVLNNLLRQKSLKKDKDLCFGARFRNKAPSFLAFSPKNVMVLSGGLDHLDPLLDLGMNLTSYLVLISDDPSWLGDIPLSLLRNATWVVGGGDPVSELAFSLTRDKQIISPYNIVHRYSPEIRWSIGGANDPIMGPWHPYLEYKGLRNWQGDYGLGIAFTSSAWSYREDGVSGGRRLYSFNFDNSIEGFNSIDRRITLSVDNLNKFEGSGSLVIEVPRVKEEEFGWASVSSPLVNVSGLKFIRITGRISALGAQGLHVKIVFTNEYGGPLLDRGTPIIFLGGPNVTFTEDDPLKILGLIPSDKSVGMIDSIVSVPEDAKYLRIEVLFLKGTASFRVWLDGLEIYDLSERAEENSFSADFSIKDHGKYLLLIRYLTSPKSGKFSVKVDGARLLELETRSGTTHFRWSSIPVELKEGMHRLTVTNLGGFNAINVIAVVREREYRESLMKAMDLLEHSKQIIYVAEEGEMNTIKVNLLTNPSDELSSPNKTWEFPSGNYNYFRSKYSITGNSSLLVYTDVGKPFTWSWIRSPMIPILNGQKYLISAAMAWENVNSSHIVIEGYHKVGEIIPHSYKLYLFGREPVERIEQITSELSGPTGSLLTPIRVYGRFLSQTTILLSQYDPFEGIWKDREVLKVPPRRRWYQRGHFPSAKSGYHLNWWADTKILEGDGTYRFFRLVLNAGWVLNSSMGLAETYFDNLSVMLIDPTTTLGSTATGGRALALTSGVNSQASIPFKLVRIRPLGLIAKIGKYILFTELTNEGGPSPESSDFSIKVNGYGVAPIGFRSSNRTNLVIFDYDVPSDALLVFNGSVTVTIENTDNRSSILVDYAILYEKMGNISLLSELGKLEEGTDPHSVNYVSSDLLEVALSEKENVVVISEPYSSLWKSRPSSLVSRAYGGLTVLYFDSPVSGTIRLEYSLRNFFSVGLLISAISSLLVLILTIYGLTSRRRERKVERETPF